MHVGRQRDCVRIRGDRFFLCLLLIPFGLQNPNNLTPDERASLEAQNSQLRALLEASPRVPLEPVPIATQPPSEQGWGIGMVSWVAADRNGLIYLLQRGDKADPVIVVDRNGKVVRS